MTETQMVTDAAEMKAALEAEEPEHTTATSIRSGAVRAAVLRLQQRVRIAVLE